MNDDRILQQVDRMVASGRITDEEAAALRAAEGTPEFDAVVGVVRAVTPVRTWRPRWPRGT